MSSTVIDGIGRSNSGSAFDTSGGTQYMLEDARVAERSWKLGSIGSRASNFETREDGDNA